MASCRVFTTITLARSQGLRSFRRLRTSAAFFPQFMTGYVIADLLLDNDWFGVQQVVIGSASSKTGFSTAAFIRATGFGGAIVGLTSDQNVAFSESLDCYDRVVS